MSRRYSRDLDFRFKAARSIAHNIKSSKLSFSPETLDDIFYIAWVSAVTNTNLFKELSVKVILRNGFHHNYVRDIRRNFDSLQRTAIATSDLKKIPTPEKIEDNIDDFLGELEVLGEEFESEPTEAEAEK